MDPRHVTAVSEPDLGYFGPDSQTWRIHGEPVSMIGGLRALLLQALHPDAMRALHAASNFQRDAWRRLQSTVMYVGTVSFAERARVDEAAARVRAVHAALGIDDPQQLAWVHACLVDSFLVAARASGLRLSTSDADTYVAEQVVAARLVGVPDELIPRTSAELRTYFQEIRPVLRITPEAREAARFVIAPPLPVPMRLWLPARVGWSTVAALAVGLLPGWARRMYRLPPMVGAGLATRGGLRTLRRSVALLPEHYREGPLYREAKERSRLAEAG
jgi:uncharacterized protein (DUF2236 family)